MNYYGYATVNATNLGFLFGLNWQPVTSLAPFAMRLLGAAVLILPVAIYVKATWSSSPGRQESLLLLLSLLPALVAVVLPVTLSVLGILLMVSSFLVVVVRYVYQHDILNLPMLGAVMLILFCVLGAMMHERYLFPAAVLLLMAYDIGRASCRERV